MIDTRANGPSEEQIEKAARAFFLTYHGEDIWPELRDDGELDTRSRALAATRVALTAAGVAPQEPCPQPCEHLSAEDAREGRDCREHPCTCPTAQSSDSEKLIEEARAVVPQAETPQCGPCRRGQHGCCDGNEYLRCDCGHVAPVLPSSGVDVETLANLIHSTSVAHFGGLDPRVAPIIARAVTEWLKEQGGESRESTDAN